MQQRFLPAAGSARQLKSHSTIACRAAAVVCRSIQTSGRVEDQIAVGTRSISSAGKRMKSGLAPASAGNRRKLKDGAVTGRAVTVKAGGTIKVARRIFDQANKRIRSILAASERIGH